MHDRNLYCVHCRYYFTITDACPVDVVVDGRKARAHGSCQWRYERGTPCKACSWAYQVLESHVEHVIVREGEE